MLIDISRTGLSRIVYINRAGKDARTDRPERPQIKDRITRVYGCGVVNFQGLRDPPRGAEAVMRSAPYFLAKARPDADTVLAWSTRREFSSPAGAGPTGVGRPVPSRAGARARGRSATTHGVFSRTRTEAFDGGRII